MQGLRFCQELSLWAVSYTHLDVYKRQAYAEVKRVLIQRKAEAGFYNLNRTDLTFEVLAEVCLLYTSRCV